MSYKHILVSHQEHIAQVTINREPKLNALNYNTIDELKKAFSQLEDDQNTWGILLTGAGEKAFVAGADIQEFLSKNKQEAVELSAFGHELMDQIAHCPKPVIAAINGFALGGGLELALACHIRIASSQAKVGLPEVSLGLIPGYGGTQRLASLVGKGKALEMILTGDMIDAQDAYKWGLINKVVPQEELIDSAQAMLKRIFLRSRAAVASAIHAVNAGMDKTVNGYRVEIESFGGLFGSADFNEGVAAFLEKRKPKF